MPRQKPSSVRLRRLVVKNFKALDFLDLEFPAPRMRHDPDVTVLGSKNGLGKTSVLEACASLYLSALEPDLFRVAYSGMPVDLANLFVRAGANETAISGEFTLDNSSVPNSSIELRLSKSGESALEYETRRPFNNIRENMRHDPKYLYRDIVQSFLLPLVAASPDPLIVPHLLYFHSYRKIQEGSMELGRILARRPSEHPVSQFKLALLRSMMSRADLFEDSPDEDAENTIAQLNILVNRYAGGTIDKLRETRDGTVEFRISTKGGGSFTFDGLSSGQKEIISTLFLIWQNTRKTPGIVLIDEPELHLNAEWHRDFIQQIHELAPDNQYIIATHSEDVFASVEEDRRVLLTAPARTADA
jgi:predicted ATPase